MRSRHADAFNHDEEAAGYDRDVLREEHPVRAGYDRALGWVAERVRPNRDSVVLELGSGTGNLTRRLPDCGRILCVDVSANMTDVARDKLATRTDLEWIQADLLEVFDRRLPPLAAVVSTYALHHLTADEKQALFARVAAGLRPGGAFVVADLMFADAGERARRLAEYRAAGQAELAQDIEEEFFWDLAQDGERLEGLGFQLERARFSDLSWGLAAVAPG